MNHKLFFNIVGTIFFLIAVLHFLRLVLGWEAVIGGWMVPIWFSTVALIVAFLLAYKSFKYSRQ